MKSIARSIIYYSVALFLTSQIISGLKIYGGLTTYIIGGIALSMLFLIVKPILSIVTLPLNIVTLGLFSFLINAIILYLLTIFVTNISITAFTFSGLSTAGFIIPKVYINNFFAFIVVSAFLSFIVGLLKWLTKK
ncbi:MAG: phage holin family protein [Candidatus Levybacteria bacterium]|nr:phage holin family protein [Candidatus Levybacteria bacterium]